MAQQLWYEFQGKMKDWLHIPRITAQIRRELTQNQGPTKTLQKMWAATDEQYEEHVADFHTAPGWELIRDDKNIHKCWKMPTESVQMATLLYVLNNKSWEMTNLSHEEAHDEVANAMKRILSNRLLNILRIDDCDMLPPKMYVTIKAKCFRSGEGRVCEKGRGHSCFRKICSFWNWKRKQEWKYVSRGLETYIKHATDTWETFRLKDASLTLQQRIDEIANSNSRHQCLKCGKEKCCIEVLVADAGQFFEAVSLAEVVSSLDKTRTTGKSTRNSRTSDDPETTYKAGLVPS